MDEFMARLPEFDTQMAKRRDEAVKVGKVIRYVGSVDMATKKAKVGLELFDRTEGFANLKGSDNLICFYTKRYGKLPLAIRGAGAGGQVTAMGITGDLIKVLTQI